MLGLMFGMHVVLFMHGKLLLHSQLTASATVLYYIKPAWLMAWHGNTTETKTDIAKFISFSVKFFHFRFRTFFVSVFVSV